MAENERKRRPPRKHDEEGKVRRWNARHFVGDPVIVTKDNGERVPTVTRSEAWCLGANTRGPGHTAVVLVEGISGAYLLDRVEPAPVAP